MSLVDNRKLGDSMVVKLSEKGNLESKIITGLKVIVVILLVFSIISTVSVFVFIGNLANDYRVVNYAGIVRGMSQSIIKLEMAGQAKEDLIAEIDSIINGLINGSKELDLPKTTDKEFIAKMKDVEKAWSSLKQSIRKARVDKNYDSLLKESEILIMRAVLIKATPCLRQLRSVFQTPLMMPCWLLE